MGLMAQNKLIFISPGYCNKIFQSLRWGPKQDQDRLRLYVAAFSSWPCPGFEQLLVCSVSKVNSKAHLQLSCATKFGGHLCSFKPSSVRVSIYPRQQCSSLTMLQFITVGCALWTLIVLFMKLSFWRKVCWSLPPALIGTILAVLQFYFAWKAWRSHWFNKVDFVVNEFLKALMGDLPYRETMARHRLHNRWLSRYCYCPPTTNSISVGFPEALYFVHDKVEVLLWKRKVHHEGTPIAEKLRMDIESRRVWREETRFRMNDILLTITKIDDDAKTGQISSDDSTESLQLVNIDVFNTLINERMKLFSIRPTVEDFHLMMTILSKWEENPDFSFIRYVYKKNYFGHCCSIKDFFYKVDKGELDFVVVDVPFGTRVLVGGTQ